MFRDHRGVLGNIPGAYNANQNCPGNFQSEKGGKAGVGRTLYIKGAENTFLEFPCVFSWHRLNKLHIALL